MPECEAYQIKIASNVNFLGREIVACPLESCPYKNYRTLGWEGEKIGVCETRGKVEKRGLLKKVKSLVVIK